MTDLGIILESMSSVFNNSAPDNNSHLDLTEDKTLKWRSLLNNQFACKKKAEGQQQQINSTSSSSSSSPNNITNNNLTNSNCLNSNVADCHSGGGGSSSSGSINNNSDCAIETTTQNTGAKTNSTSDIATDCAAPEENRLAASKDPTSTQQPNGEVTHKLVVNLTDIKNELTNKSIHSHTLQQSSGNNMKADQAKRSSNEGATDKANATSDSSQICADDTTILIKEEKIEDSSAAAATTQAAVHTTSTAAGTKRTRSAEPSPSERCLRRSRPNDATAVTTTSTITTNTTLSNVTTTPAANELKSQSVAANSNHNTGTGQQPQQQRRRGRSKKIPAAVNDETNSIGGSKNNDTSSSTVGASAGGGGGGSDAGDQSLDGPTSAPKKLRRNVSAARAETISDQASASDVKKSDVDVKDADVASNSSKTQLQHKHKTRRSTRLEVKLDNSEEMANEVKDVEPPSPLTASTAAIIKEETQTPTEEEKSVILTENVEKSAAEKTPSSTAITNVLQAVAEKTPKKRGRRAKTQLPQSQPQNNASVVEQSSTLQTSPDSSNAAPDTGNPTSMPSPSGATTTINIPNSTSTATTATTVGSTTTSAKTANQKNATKDPPLISIQSLTSQRPLRRIKPTPKILENDELRYEFETKNIARITACCNEMQSSELEALKAAVSNNGSSSKKESKESGTNSTTSSSGKVSSSNSSVCSDRYASNSGGAATAAVNEVKKKLFAKKNGNSMAHTAIVYPPMPEKKPCPDPEAFLNEIKAAKINLNRSPEDKKLNRKQQRRLLKQKEKHLEKLGLRKNTKDELSDSEVSSGEDEFVPANSKKINVGKTNVTLRFRTASTARDHIKDSSAAGPSKLNQSKKINHNLLLKPNVSLQPPPPPPPPQLQPITTSIDQIIKHKIMKPQCSIPISTTGAVTITPITSATAAQRKKRNATATTLGSQNALAMSSGIQQSPQSKSMPVPASLPINHFTTVSPSVVIATRVPMPPENFICLCQKPSHYYTRNVPGTAYCCAIDAIEEQKVGCCNQLSGELLNLLRPSQRVGYMILCDDHLKRLRAHNCCANCGIFCTQGKFVLCQQKHFFHAECAQKFILNSPYDPTAATSYTSPTLVLKCPHCGQDTPEKTSVVTMRCQTLPVFLPSQRALNKPAKMSVADGQQSHNKTAPKRKLPICADLESLIPESVMNIVVREANKMPNTESCEFSSKDMFYAVNNDDLERVAEILASGYDITCEMSELLNGTCLHIVAHFGTVQMAYLLLCRESSNEFLDMIDKEMRTALMCSIIGEKLDILKLLIQCGASLTLKGPDGMTCLHIAAKLGNVEAAQLIVENYKNNVSISKFEKFINSQDDGGWTAIVWAAELGFTEIVSLLLNYGANPNICDAENNSVLHWATLSNHVDTVSVLLRSNIDCSLQNITGDTPLHIACRTSSTQVCLMLIANGADLMVKNKAGELPYDCIESEDNQCARAVGFNMQMRSFGTGGLKNKIVCSDISNGRENNPIQVVRRQRNGAAAASEGASEVDEIQLPDFKYITKSILLQNSIQIDQRVAQMRICNCSDGCSSDKCQCGTLSIQNWYTPEGRLVGEFNFEDPAMIFECNDVCACNKLNCKNRVVQNGLKIPLQVFECEQRVKGWGVRTLINVPRGSFVCEYTGEILTDLEADRRTDDSYFFELGASEHCIDANFYGNLSRFFNHSCEPNIVPVRVYYEHQDYRFPKIAFFASKDISSGDELCFDYGDKFWSVKQRFFTCKCLHSQCRYTKLLVSSNSSSSSSSQQATRVLASGLTTAASSSSLASAISGLATSASPASLYTTSLLSSLSATSRIPAGTTITTIIKTNPAVHAIGHSSSSSVNTNPGGSSNSSNIINSVDNLNPRTNSIPNISIVL